MKYKYFTGTETLELAKKTRNALAITLHPDKGGSTEEMQQLNEEYALIIKHSNDPKAYQFSKQFFYEMEHNSRFRKQVTVSVLLILISMLIPKK